MANYKKDNTKPPPDQGKEKEILTWFTCSTEPDEKGKIAKSKIAIDLYKFSEFLISLGFVRYENDGEYFIVKVKNQIVEPCKPEEIVDAVIDHIDEIESDLVSNEKHEILKNILKSKLYSGIGTYFSDHLLNRCRKKGSFIFLEDTKDKAYFFFSNCIVGVSKDAITKLKYESIKDRYIWKDQILSRSYEKINLTSFIDSPFSKFLSNISGMNNPKKGIEHDDQRFEALCCLIGYNMHKYYQGKLKASIFTDSSLSDNPDGRTGKTLLAKAIGKMLNADKKAKTFIELNGKNFNFNDAKRYQECELDTKLVHLNDVIENFKFELLFNDISEGIKAIHHYKSPFLVNAKIIISTNRTIKVHGGSAKDRSIEFELSNHYSASYSPEKEFGHWFFRDWDKSQWLQFDSLMIYCVKLYLLNGLVEPKSINLNKRKLNEETTREFVLFLDEFLENTKSKDHDKKDLFESFKIEFPDFNRTGNRALTQRTFTKWCRLYVEYKNEFKECLETRSNGKDRIEFIKKGL